MCVVLPENTSSWKTRVSFAQETFNNSVALNTVLHVLYAELIYSNSVHPCVLNLIYLQTVLIEFIMKSETFGFTILCCIVK